MCVNDISFHDLPSLPGGLGLDEVLIVVDGVNFNRLLCSKIKGIKPQGKPVTYRELNLTGLKRRYLWNSNFQKRRRNSTVKWKNS